MPDYSSKFKYKPLTQPNRQDDGFSDPPEIIKSPKKWISKPASLEAKFQPVSVGSEANAHKSSNNSEPNQPTHNYSDSSSTESSSPYRSITDSSSEIIPDIENNADKLLSESAPLDAKNQLISFDWEKTNADRFVNSPCFKDLGFDPRMDPQELERIYKECQDAKSKRELKKNLKIGLGILLVVCFCGAIIYTFNKGQKK